MNNHSWIPQRYTLSWHNSIIPFQNCLYYCWTKHDYGQCCLSTPTTQGSLIHLTSDMSKHSCSLCSSLIWLFPAGASSTIMSPTILKAKASTTTICSATSPSGFHMVHGRLLRMDWGWWRRGSISWCLVVGWMRMTRVWSVAVMLGCSIHIKMWCLTMRARTTYSLRVLTHMGLWYQDANKAMQYGSLGLHLPSIQVCLHTWMRGSLDGDQSGTRRAQAVELVLMLEAHFCPQRKVGWLWTLCLLQWRKSLQVAAIAGGWSWSGLSPAEYPHLCCISWGKCSIWTSVWHGARSSPSSYSTPSARHHCSY